MEKNELFNKKKDNFVKNNKKIAMLFAISNIFFTLLWSASAIIVTINNIKSDIGPIIVFVCLLFTVITLILGIVVIITTKNKYTKNVHYFDDDDKLKFIPSFLKIQIVYSNLILQGILVILIGITIRGDTGIRVASGGILLMGISLSICIYSRIIRRSYLNKKSSVVNDIIIEKSFYHSTSIPERVIYLVLTIAILIMIFNLIINYDSLINKILLFTFSVGFIGYNIFTQLKNLKTFKSTNN